MCNNGEWQIKRQTACVVPAAEATVKNSWNDVAETSRFCVDFNCVILSRCHRFGRKLELGDFSAMMMMMNSVCFPLETYQKAAGKIALSREEPTTPPPLSSSF